MPLSLFNHPFFLAAAAVVAIGVAVYEILSSQEENKRRYREGRRSQRSSSPPPSSKEKPPRSPPPSSKQKHSASLSGPVKPMSPQSSSPSKSNEMPDSTAGSYSNSSGNNLRKRNLDQSSEKEKSPSPGLSSSPSGRGSPIPPSSDSFRSPPISNKTASDSTAESYSNSSGNDLRNLDFDQSSLKEKYLDDSKELSNLEQKLPSAEVKSTSSFDASRLPSNQSNETSADSAVGLHANSSVSNLGKHNFDSTSQNEKFSNDSKNSTELTPMKAEKELNETPFLENSQNIPDKMFDEKNYCKNLLDKLSNDTKDVHEKNIVKQNIYKEESDSSENNLFPENEEKLINVTSNSVSKLTDNSLSSDINTCEIQNDYGCSEDNFQCSSVSSSQKNKQKISESNLCKSCGEAKVSVQAYPCNHSYLCVECAVKIFRIYKKCSVCFQDVIEFVQIAA